MIYVIRDPVFPEDEGRVTLCGEYKDTATAIQAINTIVGDGYYNVSDFRVLREIEDETRMGR